jgi:GAF domain-containing protein
VARFRILVILAGVLALGAVSLAITSLVRHGGAARSLGWTAAPQGNVWVVDSVEPGGPADGRLQVGDHLVSLDGDTVVAHRGAAYLADLAPIGSTYTLGVERDGRDLAYVLAVDSGKSALPSRLVFLFISLVWCGVGLFIGYARPDDSLARLAFAAAVATGIVYVQAGVAPGALPPILYQPLHMVLGYHFFYRFPGGVRRGRISRILLWAFYVWAGLACLIPQPVNWVFFTWGPGGAAAWAARHSTLLRVRSLAGGFLTAIVVIASVGLIASAYRRLDDADKRRRIRWVAYGSVVGLLPLLLWAAFAITKRVGGPGLSPSFHRAHFAVNLATNAGTALIPIAVAYAVVKHRVFDIAVVVRRGLQYILAKRALQILLALPTIALVSTAALHRDLTIAQLVSQNLGYLWLIAAAGLSLRFRRPILRWLDRRFFRTELDREHVLIGLLAELAQLKNPEDIPLLVSEKIEYALHPEVVRFWFEGEPDPPPEPLLSRIVREEPGPDAPVTEGDDLPPGIHVVIPMLDSDERLTGVMMLGEKRSEEPYTHDDLSLLGVVAKQASVVREKLLLRGRVSEERRIRTDVLAHLEPHRVNLVRECPACGACYDSTADRCRRDGEALSLSLPTARTVAGRYRLDLLIGRGGMGAVYEAFDLRLKRTVAIKFLVGRPFGHEQAMRRFRREARTLARIQHPNIVEVYDYGDLDGQGGYLVMERIRGVTLREEIRRLGPLPGLAAADWFGPLLDGVAAAHEEDIIHRDLKPENVVRIRPDHGPSVVKILDFGVAKARLMDTASDRLTATGAVMGTLGYMSPEQLMGKEVDRRSDLFSVEVITGRWPFKGTTPGEMLTSIILEPYHLPGSTPESRTLDAVLQRCLAKDPRDRFPNAPELRREVVPALRGLSHLPLAAPPTQEPPRE